MRRTLTSAEVHSIVDALSASIDALNQLVELTRHENGLLPIGVPASVGTLRALIGYSRSKLLQAAVGDVHVESLEATQ
jgi:hypothetical protein